MLTSSDIANGDIEQIVVLDSTKNETRLSPLFDTQTPEDINAYTATTDKILKDADNASTKQPKTFTIQNVKQVVKEINIKPPVIKKDKVKQKDSAALKNLASKTNTTITNDDDLKVAENKSLDNFKKTVAAAQDSNLKQIAKLNSKSGTIASANKSITSKKITSSAISAAQDSSLNQKFKLNSKYGSGTSSDTSFNMDGKVIPNQFPKKHNTFPNAKIQGPISSGTKFKSDKTLPVNTKTNLSLATNKFKPIVPSSPYTNSGTSNNGRSSINQYDKESALPSFSLGGKTINKIINSDGSSDDDIGSLESGALPSISKSVSTTNPLFNNDRIPDIMGGEAYNKIRKSFDVLKDFSNCTDLGTTFDFGNDVKDSGNLMDALNDLLNTSINYDLGYFIKCLEPVVKMLDIKGVNKVIDKVGSHGSISVFDLFSSKGDKDKILDSFHKTRRTLKRTPKSFVDNSVQESADTITTQMGVNKEDFYKSSYSEEHTTENTVNGDTPIFSMQGIKNDAAKSRDFVNYAVGKTTTSLINAVPVF